MAYINKNMRIAALRKEVAEMTSTLGTVRAELENAEDTIRGMIQHDLEKYEKLVQVHEIEIRKQLDVANQWRVKAKTLEQALLDQMAAAAQERQNTANLTGLLSSLVAARQQVGGSDEFRGEPI